MSRPRKSQESKTKLLQIGTDRISQNGYFGTGLKEILTEAGVPKGSFYNYFSSKENFVEEVVDGYMDRLFLLIDNYLDRQDLNPIDRISGIHTQLITFIRSQDTNPGCLMGALAAEVGNAAPELHKVLENRSSEWIDKYAAVLKEGQVEGDVRMDMKPRALAEVFWSFWQGALIKLQIDQSADNLETSLSIMLDLVKAPKLSEKNTENVA